MIMNGKITSFALIARTLFRNNISTDIKGALGSCRQLIDSEFHTTQRRYPTGLWLQYRNYAKKLSFSYSGDLGRRRPLDEKSLVYNFKGLSQTLEQAPKVVHCLSSLEYADGRSQKYHRLEEMYDRVDQLFGANADLEQRVAKLTVEIRSLIPHCLKFRQDKYTKSRLVEKIQMRKKLLKYLRQTDYQRFLWLLRELRIRYIPQPEYHGRLTRKFRKKRAVVRAAFEVRKQKLIDLQERLEEERCQFEDYKERALAQIEHDIEVLSLDRNKLLNDQYRKPMTKFEAKTFHLWQKMPKKS